MIGEALDEMVKSAAHIVVLDGVRREDGSDAFDRRLGDLIALLPEGIEDAPGMLDVAFALLFAYSSDTAHDAFVAGIGRRGALLYPVGPMILVDIEGWLRGRLAEGAGWQPEWCPFSGPAARAWARAFEVDAGQMDPAMGVRVASGEVVRVTIPRLAGPAPGPGDEGDDVGEEAVVGPNMVVIWPGDRLYI